MEFLKEYDFVEFYSPNCGHCINAAPAMEALAEKYRGMINFHAIDCSTQVCKNIRGFPTFIYLPSGGINAAKTAKGIKNI